MFPTIFTSFVFSSSYHSSLKVSMNSQHLVNVELASSMYLTIDIPQWLSHLTHFKTLKCGIPCFYLTLHDVIYFCHFWTLMSLYDSMVVVGSKGLIFLLNILRSLHSSPPTLTQSSLPWHMLQCIYCSVVYTVSDKSCNEGAVRTHFPHAHHFE